MKCLYPLKQADTAETDQSDDPIFTPLAHAWMRTMKTTIQTTNHVRRHHGNILKALLPILAAGVLASCGSQSVAISRST